jgi:hypothetical protein
MGQFLGQDVEREIRDRQSIQDRNGIIGTRSQKITPRELAPVELAPSQQEYFNSILTEVVELYDGEDLNVELFIEAFNSIIMMCYGSRKEMDFNFVYNQTMNAYNRLLALRKDTLNVPIQTLSGDFADSVNCVLLDVAPDSE